MASFTHLHTVSGYSLRYGASHVQELAERAAERGLDALALTDRDTLAGTVRFARACAAAGVRPLFGAGLAVPDADDAAPAARGPAGPGESRRRTPVRGGAFVDESAPRAVFLARDRRGWAALCRLVGAAHRDTRPATGTGRPAGPPRTRWTDLTTAAGADGLLVLLGPDSEVGRALSAGRPDRAARLLRPWRDTYGDALRLEAVHHGRTGTGPGSLRLAARTLGFAVEQGVTPVLSNAVRYADPERRETADVLDAARLLVPVDVRRPEALDSGQRWLKDAADMARIADRVAEAAGMRRPDAHRLLRATEDAAGSCLLDPRDDLGLGRVHFPEPGLVGAAHRTADRVLRSRCAAGLVAHGHGHDRTRWDRLEHELGIIRRLGYASYFLTVAQVVADIRAMGIRTAARGSGAGSLVNHLLGIATADPVEHGLLMERFLSGRRRALPDIDIDVESARRLDVYHRILERFGPERVATVAMPETYRVRHAVRDVGAALGMDPATVDRLAKAFPHIPARDARAALAELPELRGVATEDHGRLWELVESLDGLPRGVAMHPCGVLLSDTTLLDRVPVTPTSGEGFPMAQFDKEDVEVLGLLKLDVLGVRMQSAMAHAVTEVHRATGERLDLDTLPLSPGDPATYRLIRSTETLGCFQIESPGQRDLVGRLQPRAFHDLVVDISLFRPGPVSADMVTPFVEAHNGRAPVRHPHPDLADVLRETYGVVVFHEQVIDIIAIMTGCDRAEADEMRRELSDPELRGGARVRFGAAARARGRGTEEIRRVWDIVASFGAYGFSKAHAVAFAVPTYQSAWLKTHHPAAFYAGLLTHDPGMYPKRLLLADARRRGVPLLPLDVNHSDTVHRIELVSGEGGSDGPAGPGEPPATGPGEPAGPTGRARRGHRPRAGRPAERTRPRADPGPEPGGPGPETGAPGGAVWGVRLALGDVHGISAAEAERIAAGRPYSSLLDLWQRARPGRPLAERLAQVGALDSFGPNRRDLLLRIEELHRGGRAAGTTGGQLPLAAVTDHAASAGLPDLDVTERLGAELSVLGMDTSRHLMADHRALLAELGALTADRLRATRHGQTVLVAGAKAATQTPPIRSGRRVVFTTLDDGTGLVDCAFFEDSHAACAHTVFHSWLLLIRGTLHRRGPRSHSVSGTAAWDLAELAELRRTGGLDAVAARLAQAPGAASPAGVNGADPARPVPDASDPTGGRRLHLPTGYRLHPWADLRPAGEGLPTGRKLWHASPGSAG